MASADEATTPAAVPAAQRGARDGPGAPASRVGSLRGAPVRDVDAARLRSVVAGIFAVALAVTALALFVAGARRNAQVSALHDDGVRVGVIVSGCRGLLGGSGSNPVGYACRGTFTFEEHHESVAIPGSALRAPRSTVPLVADPADPALVTTVAAATRDRPTAKVFVVPSVLLAILAGWGGAGGLRRWQRRSSSRAAAAPSP